MNNQLTDQVNAVGNKNSECAVLLAISELNVPKLISVAVMAADSEGIKVAKVLMMEEENLGVNEVALEEDMSWSSKLRLQETNLVAGRNHS